MNNDTNSTNHATKILIVENGRWYIYGRALLDAFLKRGYHNTNLFSWENSALYDGRFLSRIQDKLSIGLELRRINRDLIKTVENTRPDLVFLYRATKIYPDTVKRIREMGIAVFLYNNDNPFSKDYPWYFWRHYIGTIPYADAAFGYRHSDLPEYEKRGASNVHLLRSYYIEKDNYIIGGTTKKYDVIFLGHFEQDDRLTFIKQLTGAGIHVGVPKRYFENLDKDDPYLQLLEDTDGADYNRTINEAKIALVFLSTRHSDTYTRRCFEIPAAGTFMLSQFTDDMASLYEPDKEAVYFHTPEELLEKVQYYLAHEDEREQIARAGHERLLRDGHEVGDRVEEIMDVYRKLKG